MNLSDMEMLLQQEMETLQGGVTSKVCECETAAKVGSITGTCKCQSGAEAVPEVSCYCNNGAVQGSSISNPPSLECLTRLN